MLHRSLIRALLHKLKCIFAWSFFFYKSCHNKCSFFTFGSWYAYRFRGSLEFSITYIYTKTHTEQMLSLYLMNINFLFIFHQKTVRMPYIFRSSCWYTVYWRECLGGRKTCTRYTNQFVVFYRNIFYKKCDIYKVYYIYHVIEKYA